MGSKIAKSAYGSTTPARVYPGRSAHVTRRLCLHGPRRSVAGTAMAELDLNVMIVFERTERGPAIEAFYIN